MLKNYMQVIFALSRIFSHFVTIYCWNVRYSRKFWRKFKNPSTYLSATVFTLQESSGKI